MPVMTPPSSRSFTKSLPASVFWYSVSSYMSTPLRNWCVPGAVKSISRSAWRLASVFSTLMLVRRAPMVFVLSSAARMPFPGVPMYLAVRMSSSTTAAHTCSPLVRHSIHCNGICVASTEQKTLIPRR